MTACPRCGHPNDSPSPFCISCGAVLNPRGGPSRAPQQPRGSGGRPGGGGSDASRPDASRSGAPRSDTPRQWPQDGRRHPWRNERATDRHAGGHDTGQLGAAPPAATCPRCGEPNLSGEDWCARCGLPLGDAGGRTAPARDPDDHDARDTDALPWWRTQGFVLASLFGVLVLIGVIVFSMGGSGDAGERQPAAIDAADVASAPASAPAAAGAASAAPSAPPDETPLSVGAVSASSVLEADGDVSYEPQLTIDGERSTAWNDGVGGDPTGEWLEYTFPAPVRISRIEVVNGYDKVIDDLDLFDANARVRAVQLETDDGTTEAELADIREPQSLDGPSGPACRLRVLIDSVYPGERYDDVAVSEVTFYGTQDLQGAC